MDRPAFHQYLWEWIRSVLESEPLVKRPVILGLSAPQGAGKTTLTAVLCKTAADAQLRVVGLSIDDFYLTRGQQVELAQHHAGNRFLQQRGYPGTHDVALGASVLRALKRLGAGDVFSLPSYDKSAALGLGDRRPEGDWPRVTGPLDLVIFEGWMLGFESVVEENVLEPQLRTTNQLLKAYAVWTAMLDAFIWLEAEDCGFIVDWRAEAEAQTRAQGRPGMSDAEVRAFATRFLPAYEIYLPALRLRPPFARHAFNIRIGRDRLPLTG